MSDPPRPGRTPIGNLQEMFFRTFERDLNDGITQRGVWNKLNGHIDRDEQFQEQIHDRLSKIESTLNQTAQKAAEAEGAAAAAVAIHTGNTGRFEVPPDLRPRLGSAPQLPQQWPQQWPPGTQQMPPPGYPQYQYGQYPPGVVVQVNPSDRKDVDSWIPKAVGVFKKALPYIATGGGVTAVVELLHRLFGK